MTRRLVNVAVFDPAAHPRYTIERILERGEDDDVSWLLTIFTEEQIREVLRTDRHCPHVQRGSGRSCSTCPHRRSPLSGARWPGASAPARPVIRSISNMPDHPARWHPEVLPDAWPRGRR
jgi:hypothetical protein